MPKLLQINVTANWGSTGKIAEEIGLLAIDAGYESWIAYGRGNPRSKSNLIRIGNDRDKNLHAIQTRLFDNHGLSSKTETIKFIEKVKDIKPDIIHLHNIHGYFLNYPVLFDYLKEWGGPVVWTLHDCWPFTGHCAYYSFVGCSKWKTNCENCPQLNSYPSSWFIDRSKKNFENKKASFLGLPNLTLVPVSDWLADELRKSFLKDYPIKVIHNGIDINIFRPLKSTQKENDSKVILGVASVWERRKGLEEFIELRKLLPDNFIIKLIGLTKKQIDSLPDGIIGISRTENVEQLVKLYNEANVFVNPTLEDNFPTTNLEAIACGTPVITFNTGGSPEAIDPSTGIVIPYKEIGNMAEGIINICNSKKIFKENCRLRAEKYFDKSDIYTSYLSLYQLILS